MEQWRSAAPADPGIKRAGMSGRGARRPAHPAPLGYSAREEEQSEAVTEPLRPLYQEDRHRTVASFPALR